MVFEGEQANSYYYDAANKFVTDSSGSNEKYYTNVDDGAKYITTANVRDSLFIIIKY